MTDYKPAIVTRLECGDAVIERCSNWHESALGLAHTLMHAGESSGKDWKVTIEARQMEPEEFDAMRAKFQESALSELIALDFSKMLATTASEGGE